MITFIVGGLILVQTTDLKPVAPIVRENSDWCRGVHMYNSTGGANLLWTTFRGPTEDLAKVRSEFEAIGGRYVSRKNAGPTEMMITYRDDMNPKAVGAILNRVDAGSFGQVIAEDFAMSLDTLPADKCIRHQY
jgi:hypothetical protein